MSALYIIIIAALLAGAVLLDGKSDYSRAKVIAMVLACLSLIALAGMSYGLGGDKFYYMDIFHRYPEYADNFCRMFRERFHEMTEMPLWTLLAYLTHFTTGSFHVLQWIVAAIVNIGIAWIIIRNTDRWFTFLLLYTLSFTYFMFSTELLREACALGMCLPAIHCWTRGKKGLFAILAILGLMFHITAAVTLLFPVVSLIPVRKWDWKILAVALVGTFVIWGIYDFVRHYILRIELTWESPSILHKLVTFARMGNYIGGMLLDSLKYIVLPYVAFTLSLMWEKDNERYEAKKQFYLFALILGVMVVPVCGVVRFYNYAQVFYLMALADMIVGAILYRKHIAVSIATILLMFGYVYDMYGRAHWPGSEVRYYQLWYPYTPMGTDYPTVEYRKIAHDKAVENL